MVVADFTRQARARAPTRSGLTRRATARSAAPSPNSDRQRSRRAASDRGNVAAARPEGRVARAATDVLRDRDRDDGDARNAGAADRRLRESDVAAGDFTE